MSPIRIVILAILFYILYRLLTGGKKKAQPKKHGGSLPVQDVLVEDPVCHTYIPKKQAVSIKQHGIVHYFCSKECRDQFIDNKGEQK